MALGDYIKRVRASLEEEAAPGSEWMNAITRKTIALIKLEAASEQANESLLVIEALSTALRKIKAHHKSIAHPQEDIRCLYCESGDEALKLL